MYHHYKDFRAQDFLTDARFRKWVLSPDDTTDAFWNTFRTLYPQREKELDRARQILQQLHKERRLAPREFIDQDWDKLSKAIAQAAAPPQGRRRYLQPRLVAASISLLLVFALWAWLGMPFNARNTFSTAYGETRRLVLPDSSVVVINANSSLSYEEDWEKDETREVWLQGEAYFEVEEKARLSDTGEPLVKFIVHTPELQVEVVGTAFSVNTRSDKTQVTLNSGKVIVKDKEDAPVTMEPGEQVELDHRERKLVKKKVIPENYNSWKDNKLEFTNMPVSEIIQMLAERYGWQFRVEAGEFLDNRYKGSAPAEKPEVLLRKWEMVYGLKIRKEDNKIIISKEP